MSYAIITAGGKGARFQSTGPKQLHRVNGRTLLGWSLLPFQKEEEIREIVVVYPSEENPEQYLAILSEENISKARLVIGGPTRYDSVKNGFFSIHPQEDSSPVLIHDAARPLVTKNLIRRVLNAVTLYGAAIPVLPVYETLKELEQDKIVRTIPRENLGISQTPQGFSYSVLRKAYELGLPSSTVTDEAYMVEKSGYEVRTVEGEKSNLKVTDVNDISLVEFHLRTRPE